MDFFLFILAWFLLGSLTGAMVTLRVIESAIGKKVKEIQDKIEQDPADWWKGT